MLNNVISNSKLFKKKKIKEIGCNSLKRTLQHTDIKTLYLTQVCLGVSNKQTNKQKN